MALDGWSLDQKITKLKDEILTEMRDMKLQFAVLYDYMRKLDEEKSSKSKKKEKSSSVKN